MPVNSSIDDPKNQGPGDVIVSLCNVISTNGKQLKDFGKSTWNFIIFTESMGLLRGDAQFISGEINIADAVNVLNEMALVGDEHAKKLRFSILNTEIMCLPHGNYVSDTEIMCPTHRDYVSDTQKLCV